MLLLYKCLHNMGPSYLQEIFYLNSNSYNLRNRNDFKAEHVRTVNQCTETVSFRGPQTWGSLNQPQNLLVLWKTLPRKSNHTKDFLANAVYVLHMSNTLAYLNQIVFNVFHFSFSRF